MKNNVNAFVAAIFFLLVTSTACSKKMTVESTYHALQAGKTMDTETADDVIRTNDVNAKVMRSFYHTYGDVNGTVWTKAASGFKVTFQMNNMTHTIYYRKNGAEDGALHYYNSPDQLVPSVRNLVQSNFIHYVLTNVIEVQKNGITAYYVKVQDATTIKTVKVVDEAWEVIETLVKR
jgi:hypothetical protein